MEKRDEEGQREEKQKGPNMGKIVLAQTVEAQKLGVPNMGFSGTAPVALLLPRAPDYSTTVEEHPWASLPWPTVTV